MNVGSRAFAVCLLLAAAAIAPTPAGAANRPQDSAEERTQKYFAQVRNNPNLLLAFLREMPKGGDLHNHLSGAIYAESLIRWAADKQACVDPHMLYLSAPPCGGEKATVPASNAFSDVVLYRHMIDAFSMRNWQFSGESGHDHFFDTFDKFNEATHANTGKMLAETAARAASQHEVYQELMVTPGSKELDDAIQASGWDNDFSRLRGKLQSNGMPQAVAAARKHIDEAEATRNTELRCETAQADPGCQIPQRYLFQVLRGLPKQVVFAQMVLGFELAQADARFVGLNLVMAEDWYVPMRDFPLQMRMMQYLHGVYPAVHIALHAGELAEGLVPPEGLSFHVRDSVEIGHAERIGHGVDVMNETNPSQLLREMAERNVMVEICLTSNDVILGVSGSRHPLQEYIRTGVPAALATDDEGVSRSDMTHEYLRGAEDQNLTYRQLKNMARTSLEHAFVPGASLWRNAKTFATVPECANAKPQAKEASPSPACQSFLTGSEKARLQWKLESQFQQFESRGWTAGSEQAHKMAKTNAARP